MTQRSIALVIAITSSFVLAACTKNSGPAPSPATRTPTQFSFRQVYESSDTGLTGTDIGNASQGASGPTTATVAAGSTDAPPSAADLAAYVALDCSTPANQKAGIRTDDPAKFLVTCGNPDGSPTYFKYLLRPPVIVVTDISAASAEEDAAGQAWQLQLTLKPDATTAWAKYTASHVGGAVASVLDGNVLEGEILQGEIVGPTLIGGTFTKKSATALAKQLNSANAH